MTNNTIKVTVNLAGCLKPYVGTKEPIVMELPQGSVAGDAIARCEVPVRMIKIVNINGLKSNFDTKLNHGDQIYLQPVALGG